MLSENIVWHAHDIVKEKRAKIKAQKPCILWFTGLSGSGKSTIANAVEKQLFALQKHTYLLDGDNIRMGLNKGLTFSDEDRIENIRRIGEVAKLFIDAGIIVLSAFISPFQRERKMVRAFLYNPFGSLDSHNLREVSIKTSINSCSSTKSRTIFLSL